MMKTVTTDQYQSISIQVTSVCISGDGRNIATGCDDSNVRIWSIDHPPTTTTTTNNTDRNILESIKQSLTPIISPSPSPYDMDTITASNALQSVQPLLDQLAASLTLAITHQDRAKQQMQQMEKEMSVRQREIDKMVEEVRQMRDEVCEMDRRIQQRMRTELKIAEMRKMQQQQAEELRKMMSVDGEGEGRRVGGGMKDIEKSIVECERLVSEGRQMVEAARERVRMVESADAELLQTIRQVTDFD
jgi:septal ring factor EnvC (AmiA/AmiB activator)